MSELPTGLLPLQRRDRELLEKLPAHRVRFRPATALECRSIGACDHNSVAIIVRTAPDDGFIVIAEPGAPRPPSDPRALLDALLTGPGENSHLDVFLPLVRAEHLTAAANQIQKLEGPVC